MTAEEDRQALRDRLAGPEGLADVERMLAAPAPPPDLWRDFDAPEGAYVRAVVTRRWADPGPGHRTPEVATRTVELTAGDYCSGAERFTPAKARELAAVLLAAADDAEMLP